MALTTKTVAVIVGTTSATAALAASTFNTAVATFLAGGGTIYNTGNGGPTCQGCGMVISPDAAVANTKYTSWAQFSYFGTP